jgi:uncharacterized protein (TIGR02231 family)
MTRPLLTLAFVSALAPAAARAASSDDKIDSVVVFADRARVTRARTVPCEKGTARATFDRLPAALDTRTLRGEVREAAEVIGLASEQVNEREAADPRARELTTELDKTEADIKSKQARKAAIAAELDDVGAFSNVFSATLTEELRNPKPNTPGWGKTLDALRARRAALAEERRKLDVALRGLQQAADKLRRQIAQVGGEGQRAYRSAAVTIGCRALHQVTATVSYVIGGASWRPEYDIDVAPRGRGKTGPAAARLTVGALIRQATGEDWNNVRIMLSTARPKLGSEAPQPAPLVIDGYEQKRDKVLVQAQERREQLDAGGGGARSGPQAAALDDKGNAFVLTLPHPVTVVADGRPIWAPVDVVETQATVKLVATPKLDEHVYQIAALKNAAAYPLLEGRVRSYRHGSYVGDSRLRHQGVGAPFEISLGIDDELKVERKTLDDKDKGAGFLSSQKHIIRATRTKLTNRAGGPETIELREHIPVSKIDDVKVELLGKVTTAGYQLDAARGFVTWSVHLVNGEWRNVDLGYAIHLPDNWQVPGR